MCGIAGWVGSFPPELIGRMTQAIAHRGPDGSGEWQTEQVALGHRRLSIIDTTDTAAQPMISADERYIVSFNGEIYNFKALQEDFLLSKYKYNKNSDTAILAPLYDAFGPAMLAKLNGIFSIAIWDTQKNELFLARDHAGIKPLYYTEQPNGFAFASELKALLAVPNLDRSLDNGALTHYLQRLWCAGERTPLKSVKKLLPGHYALIKLGQGATFTRWYQQPLLAPYQPNYDITAEDLADLLDTVVHDQLVSDVPVGAFLSGGVDSSAIVASAVQGMSAAERKDFPVFCSTPSEQDTADEGFSADVTFARWVADQYGVTLHEIPNSATDITKLPELVWQLDEPTADPSPLAVWAISKAAREQGVKVLMSGSGGDDVFSGYRRHQAIHLAERLGPLRRPLGAGLSLASQLPLPAAFQRRAKQLGSLWSEDLTQAAIHAYSFTNIAQNRALFAKYDLAEGDYLTQLQAEIPANQPALNQQLLLESGGFLPDHNLNYTDKMGMAAGMEIRVPFLDPRLLEFAAQLPIQQKIQGKEAKWLLKQSQAQRLPHDLLYRQKAGFGAPVREWFASKVGQEFAQDILNDQQTQERGLFNREILSNLVKSAPNPATTDAYTLMSALMIELWCRRFQ